MVYYVSQNNSALGNGTKENPFSAIGQAASIAMPGDTIVIGGGIYREWVNPQNGGLGNNQRITYINEEGQQPVISGAELIDGWVQMKGTVWQAVVDNAVFGLFNPYMDEIFGDWYDGLGQIHHTGEVFLDGTAMYEAASLKALLEETEPEERAYRWFAAVEEDHTYFYGDFREKNPNDHCTEISVRPYCFFPQREGIDFITVSGLTMRQAATQWAPPTAFQPGLIGPHWSRGWIIENCCIYNSKCCGISLGKQWSAKDNSWSKNPAKGGSQTYTEMVFSNISNGWDRERIGGHIIRNNEISSCGQAGIVGSMGGAFCEITGNHVHHINVRQEFSGAEVAGIKLHAAIDTILSQNIIHDCVRGLWLDWEAQGTLVQKNAFFKNKTEDLFIEVCHGPCMVENNLLLSERSFLDMSQGTACVHNLFAGKIQAVPDTNRFTLYHLPHSTMVGGVMLIYGGDNRFFNNIFVGGKEESGVEGSYGTKEYDGYSHALSAKGMENDTPAADIGNTLPMKVCDNAYLNGAGQWIYEDNPHPVVNEHAEVFISEENGHYWFCTNIGGIMDGMLADQVTTQKLGTAFEPDQAYENRDGSPIAVDEDFLGCRRGLKTVIGPFEQYMDKIFLV